MKQNRLVIIILVILAAVFYCLNSFVPYYDDDIWYALRYIPNETLSPICSFTDVLESQYHHYMGENARAIVHITLQSLMAFLPDWGFDLLNTIVFVVFLLLIARYTQSDKSVAIAPLSLLVICVGVYGLLPDMDYLYYWAAGSLNYLWPSVATLVFMLMWERIMRNEVVSKRHLWLYCLLALGCAFTHEAFAIPVGGVVCLYMLINYRKIGFNAITAVAIAYGLGCMAIVFAPGMDNKTQHIGYESLVDFVLLAFESMRQFNVFNVWLVVVLLSMLRASWRKSLWQFVKDNAFLATVAVVSFVMIIILKSGMHTMRICYANEFFALLLLLRYLNQVLKITQRRYTRALTIAVCVPVIAWGVVVIPAAYRTGRQHYALIESFQSDSDGLLFLPEETTPRIAKPWVMDLHKIYYNTPESQWRGYVIPLIALSDTLQVPNPYMDCHEDGRYKLYDRYIRILPHELQPAIETPHEFFTLENKIKGNNPFYGVEGGSFYIAPADSISADDSWQWYYYPASWRDPSASIMGFVKRLVAPSSLPMSEPVRFPITVKVPDQKEYVIIDTPPYRKVKSIETVL